MHKKEKLPQKSETNRMKKYLGKKLSWLHQKAWDLFSVFIRTSYADKFTGYVQCYTCPAIKHWKEMDAGHYIHSKLDFDIRNIHPQCRQCNGFRRGRLDVYGERLTRENGFAWIEQLRRDANSWQQPNRQETIELIEEYA
jgi:hypothetical protein